MTSLEKQCNDFFWDDVTGRPLDTKLVKQARAEEIEKIYRTNLYTQVPTK